MPFTCSGVINHLVNRRRSKCPEECTGMPPERGETSGQKTVSPKPSKSPSPTPTPSTPIIRCPFGHRLVCKEDCEGTTIPCGLIDQGPSQNGEGKKSPASLPEKASSKSFFPPAAKCSKNCTGVPQRKKEKTKGGIMFFIKRVPCRPDCAGTVMPCGLMDKTRPAYPTTGPSDAKVFFAEQASLQSRSEDDKKSDVLSAKSSDSGTLRESSSASLDGEGKKKKKKKKKKKDSARNSNSSSSTSLVDKGAKKKKKKKRKGSDSARGSDSDMSSVSSDADGKKKKKHKKKHPSSAKSSESSFSDADDGKKKKTKKKKGKDLSSLSESSSSIGDKDHKKKKKKKGHDSARSSDASLVSEISDADLKKKKKNGESVTLQPIRATKSTSSTTLNGKKATISAGGSTQVFSVLSHKDEEVEQKNEDEKNEATKEPEEGKVQDEVIVKEDDKKEEGEKKAVEEGENQEPEKQEPDSEEKVVNEVIPVTITRGSETSLTGAPSLSSELGGKKKKNKKGSLVQISTDKLDVPKKKRGPSKTSMKSDTEGFVTAPGSQ